MTGSATKQSIFPGLAWIASRSLSSGAHSRDPLARNDDFDSVNWDDAKCAEVIVNLDPQQRLPCHLAGAVFGNSSMNQ